MAVNGGWAQAGSYPASVDRKILGAAFVTQPGISTPRTGVLPVADRFAFVSFANMTMVVQRGAAILPGGYVFYNDGAASVTFDAVGSSPRTDLIVLRQYDAEAGDASTQATIEVVKGTSAAVPIAPSRSLVIASVAFPANAATTNAANASDARVYTSGAGGVITIPGALSGAASLLNLVPGTPVWDPQNGGRLGVVGGPDNGWYRVGRDMGFLPSAAQISVANTPALTLVAQAWTPDNAMTMDFQDGAGDVQVIGTALRLVTPGIYVATVMGEWGVGSSAIGNQYYAGFGIGGAVQQWSNASRANSFARTHPTCVGLVRTTAANQLLQAYFATNDANAPGVNARSLSAYRIL